MYSKYDNWQPMATAPADGTAGETIKTSKKVNVFTFFIEELDGVIGPKTRIVTQSAKLCFMIPLDSWLWQRIEELLELTTTCQDVIIDRLDANRAVSQLDNSTKSIP
jgi:hypothetical protein